MNFEPRAGVRVWGPRFALPIGRVCAEEGHGLWVLSGGEWHIVYWTEYP